MIDWRQIFAQFAQLTGLHPLISPLPPPLPKKRGAALFKKSNSDNNYNTPELIIPGFYTNLTQALGESANDNIPNFSGSP